MSQQYVQSGENTETSGGLYCPGFEHDACGIGVVADRYGRASARIVRMALAALRSMGHRGAVQADGVSGDGAGLMVDIPHEFLVAAAGRAGFALPARGRYGLGMLMIPGAGQGSIDAAIARVREACSVVGLVFLGMRRVPVREGVAGKLAALREPRMIQVFAGLPDNSRESCLLEPRLYLMRRYLERESVRDDGLTVASLSSRTVVYKGMLLPADLSRYFSDLDDPSFKSAVAVVHSRFSTNTLPQWGLAHPFRYLCHNGEINTIRGNLAWSRVRERDLLQAVLGRDDDWLFPLIQDGLSDSASLDRAFEMLILAGCTPAGALNILMPEAWEHNTWIRPAVRRAHERVAPYFEPWDGPAAVIAYDGRHLAVALDRNGLRPCRTILLRDGTLIVASEAGVVGAAHQDIDELSRLGPGGILELDTASGQIVRDQALRERLACNPFLNFEPRITQLEEIWAIRNIRPTARAGNFHQILRLFGYSHEELEDTLATMAALGEEPLSSMGDDEPPAVLSSAPRLLYDYLRQCFAQVTNPPIDPLRECMVMSLRTWVGSRRYSSTSGGPHFLQTDHPVLSCEDFDRLLTFTEPRDDAPYRVVTLRAVTTADCSPKAFEAALAGLGAAAVESVRAGAGILVISDRLQSVGEVPLPMLLAAGAVRRSLSDAGLLPDADLVADTGEARSVHHLACLFGVGVRLVHPWLALEIISDRFDAGLLDVPAKSTAQSNYIKACEKGLLKIMSKMGIATLRSYTGAAIFEALGLSADLCKRYLLGMPSPLGGIGTAEICAETRGRFAAAMQVKGNVLPIGAHGRYRAQNPDRGWSPGALASLRQAVQQDHAGAWEEFVRAADRIDQEPVFLRHLLMPVEAAVSGESDPEDVRDIVRRFTTGAMSLGAISAESHVTLALAMNQLGGKSNSGEGGEAPERSEPAADGTVRTSAIRQVASGRFGVTAAYLADAREIQIKMAQGAKPGEGGQLPGHKVDTEIARLRHSQPGVTLISPPPHHDIYSIEDLAQLIFDLRQVNPRALVSVKLVSTTGIGTIAAGVVKAGADKIVISCGSGGTGASPLSSVRHAGMPWETGIAEVHQVLTRSGLRERVTLEVDGQLKTGRDVIVAAMLGADEFGFATAPLVAQGCIMMRKCHLGTCPVGIATQDPRLRLKFAGKPEHVVRYFMMVGADVRRWLGIIGLDSLADARGRTDLLTVRPDRSAKAATLDLRRLLFQESSPSPAFQGTSLIRRRGRTLAPSGPGLLAGNTVQKIRRLTVGARSIGAGCIRYPALYGNTGTPLRTFAFTGWAGQSFGAFLPQGFRLHLKGVANDYVGKGLSGGSVVVAAKGGGPLADKVVLAGNTCLYGATSGELFIAGAAGERFAVRNSGAVAVVEGVGDHGCEYMTGGTVVVLGMTGRNFAAGMSGGTAYILDLDGFANLRVNHAMVELDRLKEDGAACAVILHGLIQRHVDLTGSRLAQSLLRAWDEVHQRFLVIRPRGMSAGAGTSTGEVRMVRRQAGAMEAGPHV